MSAHTSKPYEIDSLASIPVEEQFGADFQVIGHRTVEEQGIDGSYLAKQTLVQVNLWSGDSHVYWRTNKIVRAN